MTDYESKLLYGTKLHCIDSMVPMRDGVKVAVGVFLPDKEGKYPALLACEGHNNFKGLNL